VPLFVGYSYIRGPYKEASTILFVSLGFTLRPLGQFLVALPSEHIRLDPTQPTKPSVGGEDSVDLEVFHLSDWLQLYPKVFAELPQSPFVFPGQEDLLAKEAVLHGVEADGVHSLRRLGAGALEGVLSVGSGFLLARHDIDLSVIFVSIRPKEL
jgi:hypothetical protein